jgi:putative addiction module component (TIGR02574 family)
MIALDELIKLPAEERIQIIEVLEQSLETDETDFRESPELIAEIMRRDAEYQATPSTGVRWENLMGRLLTNHG